MAAEVISWWGKLRKWRLLSGKHQLKFEVSITNQRGKEMAMRGYISSSPKPIEKGSFKERLSKLEGDYSWRGDNIQRDIEYLIKKVTALYKHLGLKYDEEPRAVKEME